MTEIDGTSAKRRLLLTSNDFVGARLNKYQGRFSCSDANLSYLPVVASRRHNLKL